MSFLFRPQSCRFFLNGPFTETINDQLQNLPFDPVNGVRLSFQSCTKECHQSVTIEIDSEGILSKLSVIDPETNSADMIYDFSQGVFNHYGECLDITHSQPIFQILQNSIPFHNSAGHDSVTVTAL